MKPGTGVFLPRGCGSTSSKRNRLSNSSPFANGAPGAPASIALDSSASAAFEGRTEAADGAGSPLGAQDAPVARPHTSSTAGSPQRRSLESTFPQRPARSHNVTRRSTFPGTSSHQPIITHAAGGQGHGQLHSSDSGQLWSCSPQGPDPAAAQLMTPLAMPAQGWGSPSLQPVGPGCGSHPYNAIMPLPMPPGVQVDRGCVQQRLTTSSTMPGPTYSDCHLPSGPLAFSDPLATVSASTEHLSTDDIASLAAMVAQEKMAQIEQLEAMQQLLREEVISLLPLI